MTTTTQRQLRQRVLIDDSFVAAPTRSVNFFSYLEDGRGSSSGCLPAFNYTCGEAGVFNLTFTGVGVEVFGAAVCVTESTADNSTQVAMSYTELLDSTVIPTSSSSYEEPLVYHASGLQNTNHLLEYKLNPCDDSNNGPGAGTFSYVDFALVSLDIRTPIVLESSMLVAVYDDPFIDYSPGDWSEAARAPLEHLVATRSRRIRESGGYLAGMETRTVGAWVSFSFFGDFVASFGSLFSPFADLVIGPAVWATELSLSVTLDGETFDHNFPNPAVERFPFWESNTLSELPDSAPHVVNITLKAPPGPEGNDRPFRVEGFMYRPLFSTLEEGNQMFQNFASAPTDSQPQPSESADPDAEIRPSPASVVAPIVGGVIGGVALILALAGLLFWYRSTKRKRGSTKDGLGSADAHRTSASDSPDMVETSDTEQQQATAEARSGFRDLTPYMKSYVSHGGTAASSMTPIIASPSDPTVPTPYRKRYQGEQVFSPPSTREASEPSSLAPYLKSYEELDPASLLRHPSPAADTGPSSPRHGIISHREDSPRAAETVHGSGGLDAAQGSARTASANLHTPAHLPPPSFVSNEDDRNGPETPTTRLIGIIQRMRAQMDAMEAPPAYAGDTNERDG